MTGILLINMGGAEDPKELKQFLRLMFLDKHVIAAPFPVRKFLSVFISNTRYKKSWKKYELTGGTPIKKDTLLTATELQTILGSNYSVSVAYSYSNPLISESISAFAKKKITKIIAIPLYPQASITTTLSVVADIDTVKKKHPELNISLAKEFYSNNHFIDFWCGLIKKHTSENKLTNPFLIFSAHSIPVSFIKKGDTYQKSIEGSAKLIAEKCSHNYTVSYQSGMNPKTWIGPGTKEIVGTLAKEGKKEIVIIPISFVGENLETLYDLDKDIVPWSKTAFAINISRVKFPSVHKEFLSLLENLIKEIDKL